MAFAMRASQAAVAQRAAVRSGRVQRSVVVVRATEEGPSTSGQDNTVFYGGRSYNETEWNNAVANGTVAPSARESAANQAAVAVAPSLTDVMAFGGAAPEITNGRLAMLGFVAAVAAELSSGEGVLKQWTEEPTGIAAAFVIFMAASLAPLLQSSGAQGQSLGPFTPKAEMINGRAAMLGFAALLVIEAVKGTPLF